VTVGGPPRPNARQEPLPRRDLHQGLPGLVVDLQRGVTDAEALVEDGLQLTAAQMAVVAGGNDDEAPAEPSTPASPTLPADLERRLRELEESVTP